MKIAQTAINKYIDEKIEQKKAILIFGPEEGIAAEIYEKVKDKIIGKKHDPFHLEKIGPEKIKEDEDIIKRELNTQSLIPGKRLLTIEEGGVKNIEKIIQEALSGKKTENFIAIRAGDLKPSSKLRSYFEKEEDVISVACYAPEESSNYNFVKKELEQYSPDAETISYISQNIKGNRLLIRQEIEKIKTFYYGKKTQIKYEDIVEIIAKEKNDDYQSFANKVAQKNSKESIEILDELISRGEYPQTLIRVLSNYFKRMLEVKGKINQGKTYQEAIKNLKPPVFFKQKEILYNHISIWEERELSTIIEKLFSIEKLSKKSPNINTETIIRFFVLMISKRKK